jgi:phosphoenolpyruvate synthase/pyruvate phosphate dikinase
VSRGVAAGPVRVVHTADDLDTLEPGEVLVCEATSPSWGYAFTLAAAVVCDTGGPTTHAAICARERGIPCVVAAQGATRALADGDWVAVDGATGTVTPSR